MTDTMEWTGTALTAPSVFATWIGGHDVTKRTCSFTDCDGGTLARGWCRMHYLRWWRTQPLQVRPTFAERFWEKVDRDGPLPAYRSDLGPCWLWTAGLSNAGYAHFHPSKYTGKGAHRVAYELAVGQIPEGFELDHLCRVPRCVNPSHLEPVTHLENMRRGAQARTG